METPTDNQVRFSLRDMLLATSYVALTAAVVSFTGSIHWSIHLFLPCIGFSMWRYAHGHLGGVVLALLGGDILLCSSIGWISYGVEDFMGFRDMSIVFASFLIVAALGTFSWAAAKEKPFWRNQMGIAITIFLVFIAWWIAIPPLGRAAVARRQNSDMAANIASTANAISMVQNAVLHNGNAPDNTRLAELLSDSLPAVQWDGFSQPIQYQKTSDNSFQLSYVDPSVFLGDIVVYDSTTPKKGWYRIPF